MDLEYFSNSSKKSTELYGMDVLQDQKVNISNFIKQNEGDWEIILQNLAISQVFLIIFFLL